MSVRDFADDWIVPNQHDYVVIDDGVPVGVLPLTRLIFLGKGLGDDPVELRRNIPKALPDEPIDDVLERTAGNSLTIIPVMERGSASSREPSRGMTSST